MEVKLTNTKGTYYKQIEKNAKQNDYPMPPAKCSLFSPWGIKDRILGFVALFFQGNPPFQHNETLEWLRTYNTAPKEALWERRVAWIQKVFPSDIKNEENELLTDIKIRLENGREKPLEDIVLADNLGSLVDAIKKNPNEKTIKELAREHIKRMEPQPEVHFFAPLFERWVRDIYVQETITAWLYVWGGVATREYCRFLGNYTSLLATINQSVIKALFRGWIGVEVAASILTWTFSKITEIPIPGHFATPIKSILRTFMRNGQYNDHNDGIKSAIHSLLKGVLVDVLIYATHNEYIAGVIGSVAALFMMAQESTKRYKDYFEPLFVSCIGLLYIYWDSVKPLAFKLI